MKYIFFIVFVFGTWATNFAQTKNELEQRKENTLKELELAKELLDKTQIQKKSSMNRLALLNSGIHSRTKLIETINTEIILLDNEIDELEQQVKVLSENVTKGKQEYTKIIYTIYINHTEEDKLMYLLASEDLNQFYQRIKYMKYLKDYREKKIAEMEKNMEELNVKTTELLRIRNNKSRLLSEKESENRSLLNERNERNVLVSRLSQDERRLRQQIEEKERIRKELEEKIRKIIEEEAMKSRSNTLYATLTPEQKLLGTGFLQNKGRLPWPVSRGVITAEFGPIPHPILPGVIINSNGIDISSTPGSKARALFEGEVTRVFAILGANYAVIVMHGEYLSVYQNLVDLRVKPGDKVVTKQELGTIHADADVAVLHLQIWKSREILDPSLWISK